jgi:hypothetical protein
MTFLDQAIETDGSQNAPKTIAITKRKAAPMINRSKRSARLITPSCVIDLSPTLAELALAARGMWPNRVRPEARVSLKID